MSRPSTEITQAGRVLRMVRFRGTTARLRRRLRIDHDGKIIRLDNHRHNAEPSKPWGSGSSSRVLLKATLISVGRLARP